MRNSWVRLVLSGLIAAAVFVACDDNPVDEGRDDATRLQVNPTWATLNAADTAAVSASAVSRYGDPTLAAVTFEVCDAKITFEADQSRVTLEPPDRVLVIGQTLGESCVVASSGSLEATAVVNVVPASLVVTAAPDTLRAGQTGEVVVQTLDAAGVAVGPFVRTDLAYATSADTVAALTDDMGSVATETAGQADITATWSGGGISREVSHTIVVIPNVPTAAAFESASFGAVGAAGTSELEVVVTDALGNKNEFDNEILSVTAQAVPAGVVDVDAQIVPTMSVNVMVTVTGVGAGTAEVTGTVTTSAGDLDFGPADVTVLNPIIESVTPSSGPFASSASIAGSGFVSTGFETVVLVDGKALGDIDVVSGTRIDVTMPVLLAAGSYDVVVEVGGVGSGAGTWTQVGALDSDDTEPENDDPATPTAIAVPFEFVGSFSGGDIDDIFEFTLSSDATIDIELDWVPAKDLDFFVTLLDGSAADGNFDGAGCEGWFNMPETGSCSLTAGTYQIWVEDFDALDSGDFTPVNYSITGVIQ